jgi:hypothetical protein
MGTPQIELRVGGERLASRGAHGDLSLSWSWPGGCAEASWRMAAKFGSRVPTLVRGALVEVLWGGWPIWTGTLQEPDWNGTEVQVTAAGLVRLGERYMAFDGATNTTDVASTAIDQAISRGLQWIRHSSVPTTALATGTTDAVNSVSALNNAHAEKDGQRWGVDAFRNCYFAADPTTPFLYIRPGSGDLGISDDSYASHVVLRHVTTSGGYRSAIHPAGFAVTDYELKYGHSEFVREVVDRGPMADADADALAEAVYTRTLARPGWTNGLLLAHGEVLNEGGQAIHPLRVAAEGYGKLVQLRGVMDEVALTSHTNFVAGATSWSESNPTTVSVDPVGLVSRTQEDVLTELLEAMDPPEAA